MSKLEKRGVKIMPFEHPRTTIPAEAARQQQDCDTRCDWPSCWYQCWYGGCYADYLVEAQLYDQRYSFQYMVYEH